MVAMGSRLRRQLREALPPEIKGLPRAVALEIADDARWDDAGHYDPDGGRRSKVTLAELARWTGAKNERVVSDALRVLGLAGWEFRVPFGRGKDGRVLYAVPGRAMEFRVPDFAVSFGGDRAETEGPVLTGPCPEGPVTTASEAVVTVSEAVVTASEAATAGPPSPVPDSPLPPSPPPADSAPDREGGREDAPPPEEQRAAQALARAVAGVPQLALGAREIARLAPLVVPWLERTTEGVLRDALTAGLPAAVGNPLGLVRRRLLDKLPPPAAAPRTDGLPPWCGHCGDGMPAAEFNPRFRVLDGGGLCGCHPDAA